MNVFPSYYHKFHCIASSCRHSCCIGWEIDIDEDTYGYYQGVEGELGQRLRRVISDDGTLHFLLGKDERCPFLNCDNLCELILSLGDASLCEICREHPRCYNVLSDRTEVGLGLCCEEAARLILTEEQPMTLVCKGDASDERTPFEEKRLSWRERVFLLLQDRTKSFSRRADEVLALCERKIPPIESSIELLLTFEIMTDEWKALLSRFRTTPLDAFDRLMASRECEYEQFAVYLAYRYLVTAYDGEELFQKTAFIIWAYRLIRSLGAFLYAERGVFSPDDQIELARLFSVELEYDEDNLLKIFTLL